MEKLAHMAESSDGCLQRSVVKTAGATLYLMEELGDARLRCDQLMRYIDEAVRLIEKSEKKDHFIEVAGHLITGMPETAFKLQKALQAVALAASRIDYEELKQELRPEKVEELERVLKEVRIRPVKHRSENSMLTPKEAAARIREFARVAREEGSLPLYDVAAFISELNPKRQASESLPVADAFDKLAGVLEAPATAQPVTRVQLATLLSRIAMESEFDTAFKTARRASAPKLTQEFMQLGDVSEVKEKFKAENPDISDEALNEIAEQWKKNKDVVKDKTALDPGNPGLVENFEAIRTHAIASARAANVARWRPALLGLALIVDEIGTVLVKLGSMDTQKSEALKREIRQLLPQAAKNVEQMGPLSVLASSDDPHWITAKYPGKATDGTAFKKGDRVLYYPRTKRFLVGEKAEAAMRKFESELADEAVYNGKTADAAEEARRSRFEQGKPADPTENMDKDDAAEWKENTDEHKDNFKAAGLRWKALFPKSHSSHGHFFDLEVDGASFRIEPVTGPNGVHVMLAGDPLYRLLATLPGQGTIKYRRQLTDVNKLKSVAEAYAKTLQAPAGGVDFTNEWTKTALGPDGGHFSKYEEGKPADPTENMSPEDAKAWKENTDEHGDKFKAAASSYKGFSNSLGEVIESRRWEHKETGATASLYGAVPWSGAKGDQESDWKLETVGYTVQWKNGTIGMGRQPFKTEKEAEDFLKKEAERRGKAAASNDPWKAG